MYTYIAEISVVTYLCAHSVFHSMILFAPLGAWFASVVWLQGIDKVNDPTTKLPQNMTIVIKSVQNKYLKNNDVEINNNDFAFKSLLGRLGPPTRPTPRLLAFKSLPGGKLAIPPAHTPSFRCVQVFAHLHQFSISAKRGAPAKPPPSAEILYAMDA